PVLLADLFTVGVLDDLNGRRRHGAVDARVADDLEGVGRELAALLGVRCRALGEQRGHALRVGTVVDQLIDELGDVLAVLAAVTGAGAAAAAKGQEEQSQEEYGWQANHARTS